MAEMIAGSALRSFEAITGAIEAFAQARVDEFNPLPGRQPHPSECLIRRAGRARSQAALFSSSANFKASRRT